MQSGILEGTVTLTVTWELCTLGSAEGGEQILKGLGAARKATYGIC